MVSVVWFSYYSCGIILFTWEVYAAIRNETVILVGPINEIFTASISIRGSAPGTLSGVFSLRDRKRESVEIVKDD
jgi:hypothetical protein